MFKLVLPDIGEGVVEAEIQKWFVAPGDEVHEDQPLVEVMTDKATVTIPSPRRGKVTKLRLSATVSPNTVPDGLHGDVFAIGAADDEGFFALSVGRRIDLRVRPQ